MRATLSLTLSLTLTLHPRSHRFPLLQVTRNRLVDAPELFSVARRHHPMRCEYGHPGVTLTLTRTLTCCLTLTAALTPTSSRQVSSTSASSSSLRANHY